MPPLLALLACLALGAGCLGAETPCQAPLSWRRHARLSGGQLRLASFIARLDGLRVSLEYDKESVIDEDKWVLDIDIATTSCLMKDGEAWTSTLDEADEDLLARECDPGSGYQLVEGAWLKLHRRPLDWKYAQEVCWREGGRLAVVDTRLKVAALRQVLLARPDVLQSSVLRGQVLVGMNDVRREGVFETSSGEVFEPWNEMVWFPNEPDDASPGEDCVTFHVLGRIRDVPCYYELPFVCERESP